MLRLRQLIPPMTVHTPDGRNVRAWDFKQKKNLVVAFLDAGCAPCGDFLLRFAARAADLRASEAVVLAVFLEPPAREFSDFSPLEIIAGSDMPARAVRAYLGDDALSSRGLERRGVFVADRYGELFARWTLPEHDFPAIDEILASLEHAGIACGDGGAAAWPVDL
jgi:peroxiredoxin